MPIYAFTITDDETGDEIRIEVPGRFEVCSQCNGEGTELYGSLKGAVFSAQDFAEDPDFAEDYFGGHCDVPCAHCHGDRVEAVPDVSQCSWAQKRDLVRWRREQARWAEYRAQQAWDRSLRERGIEW